MRAEDKEKQNISMKEILTKRSVGPIINCNCREDKEKQICKHFDEEVCSKLDCKKDCKFYGKANCLTCIHEDICQLRTFSYCEEEVKEKGCEHYQPKLPEDSVVLSREEYEKKKKHLQNVLELSSFQLENVVKENEKLKEQLKDKKLLTEENYNKLCHLAYFGYDDAYEKGSKETVEKFVNLPDSDILVVDTQEYGEIEVVSVERLQEIAKQFNVEMKE